MMLFLLPLYMLRRNAEVVGGACGCWPCANVGPASDTAAIAVTKSLFIMRAILPHDLANRPVLFVQEEHPILRSSTKAQDGAPRTVVLRFDQLQQRLRVAVEQH